MVKGEKAQRVTVSNLQSLPGRHPTHRVKTRDHLLRMRTPRHEHDAVGAADGGSCRTIVVRLLRRRYLSNIRCSACQTIRHDLQHRRGKLLPATIRM